MCPWEAVSIFSRLFEFLKAVKFINVDETRIQVLKETGSLSLTSLPADRVSRAIINKHFDCGIKELKN